MPKDDAERSRPPHNQARTRHPPTHPSRAAQPHRHPDRVKGAHEPPVTMGTDRRDRHESPAQRPVRPKATPQPDSMAEQGHDIALLMRRGLISEKALGRSLPGYQDGGRPRIGEPAMVGELGSDPASAMSAKMIGGKGMTPTEEQELGEALASGAVLGGGTALLGAAANIPLVAILARAGVGRDALMGLIDGTMRAVPAAAVGGAAVGGAGYEMGLYNPRQDAIDRRAMSDLQPLPSGEGRTYPGP
jgi:hypothetical protein